MLPCVLCELKVINNYVLQVSQLGVRLLQGDEQIQHIPLDLGSPVTFASSADPYVVILTEDGQMMLLTLREGRGETKLHVSRPQLSLVCFFYYLYFEGNMT